MRRLGAALILQACAVAVSIRAEPPRIPPLSADQPVLSRLIPWRDGLAAVTELDPAVYFAEPDAQRFRLLVLPACDRAIGVASHGSRHVALCRNGTRLGVVDATGSSPVLEVPSLPIDELGAHVAIGDGGQLAVVTTTAIALHSEAAGWHSIAFTAQKSPASVPFPPVHLLFALDSLWLGYEGGEFGGALYRLRIPAKGPLPVPERVRELNVLGIAHGASQATWIGAGVSHMGVRKATLLRVDSEGVAEIAIEWGARGRRRAFAAFTASAEGVPVVVEAETGVYEVHGTTPVCVVDRSLDVRHERTLVSDSGEVFPATTHYGPTDIVAWPDGRYFVATNGLGVLELSGARGTSGSVRQLLLPAAAP
jgi:hypothetical protein